MYQTVRIAKLKAELKLQETTYAAQWASAQQDGPYEKGSHPFKDFFLLAYWLLRSELQLWGSTLPSNEESLQVFVNICEALIAELNRVLSPLLVEEKSRMGANPVVRKVTNVKECLPNERSLCVMMKRVNRIKAALLHFRL